MMKKIENVTVDCYWAGDGYVIDVVTHKNQDCGDIYLAYISGGTDVEDKMFIGANPSRDELMDAIDAEIEDIKKRFARTYDCEAFGLYTDLVNMSLSGIPYEEDGENNGYDGIAKRLGEAITEPTYGEWGKKKAKADKPDYTGWKPLPDVLNRKVEQLFN